MRPFVDPADPARRATVEFHKRENPMKRILPYFLTAAAATFIPTSAHAGTDYRCTIEKINDVDGDESTVIEAHRKFYIGKEFTVDRRSGLMAGALKNAYATQPVVVDSGSKGNSFKAVTTMRRNKGAGAGSTVFTLVVKEFAETPKKPFVFLSDVTVYFGNCIYF